MNIFDDLADPLGPPPGDALGSVLARARRRRAVRRRAAGLIAVAAVVTVVVSANALTRGSSIVRVTGTSTTLATPKPTVAPTSTSTSTSRPATTGTQSVTGRGPWTDEQLTITPRSLGGVRAGMTFDQAQTAAGQVFDGTGDGAFYSRTVPIGLPHLFMREDPNGRVECVGAEIGDQATNAQMVSTREGFRLGDTVQQLQAIYGGRARYSPSPGFGISPRAGYVVAEPDGNLAFSVDRTNTKIFGIKGGGPDLTPSSCPG